VREFIESNARERADDVAYSRMQATKPQTVAYGLTDSPAGLTAWIVDLSAPSAIVRRDRIEIHPDQLLTNPTIYWVTARRVRNVDPPANRADLRRDRVCAPQD
jgi:hypothetical protein